MLDCLYLSKNHLFKEEEFKIRIHTIYRTILEFYLTNLMESFIQSDKLNLANYIKIIDNRNFFDIYLIRYFEGRVVHNTENFINLVSGNVQELEKLFIYSYVANKIRYDYSDYTEGRNESFLSEISKKEEKKEKLTDYDDFIRQNEMKIENSSYIDEKSVKLPNLFNDPHSLKKLFIDNKTVIPEEVESVIEVKNDFIEETLSIYFNKERSFETRLRYAKEHFKTILKRLNEKKLAQIHKTLSNHYKPLDCFKMFTAMFLFRNTIYSRNESLLYLFEYSSKIYKNVMVSKLTEYIDDVCLVYGNKKANTKDKISVSSSKKHEFSRINIKIDLDFPLNHIFTEKSFETYNKIFDFLFFVRKIEHGNSVIYKKLKNYKSGSNLLIDGNMKLNIQDKLVKRLTKKLIFRFAHLRMIVNNFIKAFLFFIENGVIDGLIEKFTETLDSCSDLKELKDSHDHFLHSMGEQLLVTGFYANINSIVMNILQKAENFFKLINNFENIFIFHNDIAEDLQTLLLHTDKKKLELERYIDLFMRTLKDQKELGIVLPGKLISHRFT